MQSAEITSELMRAMTERARTRQTIGGLVLAWFFGVVSTTMACGNSSPDTHGTADTSANTQQGGDTGGLLLDSPTLDLAPSAFPLVDASVDSLACDPSMAVCGDHCVDYTLDHDNCGGCSLACAAGDVCYLGQCNQTCPAGTTECGGGCADFQSDLHHCGGCSAGDAGSFACESDQVCRRGRCAAGCDAPLVICFGRCIDPMTNPIFCGLSISCTLADGGSSGTTCAQGQVCSGGVCESACEGGQGRCPDGACRHFLTDNDNCGLCGSVCALDKKCTSGVCVCIVPGTCGN
jgi:Stigma-specific protein, Stig1